MKFHHRQGISNLSELCVKNELHHIVIAPGSRNAPLIFSFANHRKIKTYSITDERSAAYFALGLAIKLNKPVGIVCTSGTSSLNFIPAVAEAFYQRIPLLIFTADRPKELIDQFDGQTINQTNIYQNFVCKSFELPVETSHPDDLWHFNRIISESINESKLHSLPCHINIPLREPLYDELPAIQSDLESISTVNSKLQIEKNDLDQLREKWNGYNKKMVICGYQKPSKELEIELNRLSQAGNVVIINENLSNINLIDSIESPDLLFRNLFEEKNADFAPDLLITLGGSVISKVLKQYIRLFKPAEHWNIDPFAQKTDTYKALNKVINVEPVDFFQNIDSTNKKEQQDYKKNFLSKYYSIRHKTSKYIDSLTELTDSSAISTLFSILKTKKKTRNIHLSNSMTVRYTQIFETLGSTSYFCNRGTSGIDGSTSTAAGFSYNDKAENILITGDLAFLYDSNILQHPELLKNLKIIVLNNQGGNIFEIINKNNRLEGVGNLFITPQNVNLKKLSEAYALEYHCVQNFDALKGTIIDFLKTKNNPAVLEIKTDIKNNTKTIKALYNHLK